MLLTRAHFLVTESSLFVLSLMCGYHTPRSTRWIYAFLQAVHFCVVLWFIPVSNFTADYLFACGMLHFPSPPLPVVSYSPSLKLF